MDNQQELIEVSEMEEDIYKEFGYESRSILRVVTCDFNKGHPDGYRMHKIQEEITKDREYIDTVFRPTKNNPLVLDGVINVKKKRFIKGKQLMSKANKSTYIGKCGNCKEMCGVSM
jgi:hypothetical protein